MMRLLALTIALSPAAACSDSSPAPKRFSELMEAQEHQMDGITKESQKKPADGAALRSRTTRLLGIARDAAAIRSRQKHDEQAKLDAEFKPYLALLEKLESDPWSDAAGNLGKIDACCAACHEKFKPK